MKRALAFLGAPLLFLVAGGCEASPPEVDQIAQQSMIGLAKKKNSRLHGRAGRAREDRLDRDMELSFRLSMDGRPRLGDRPQSRRAAARTERTLRGQGGDDQRQSEPSDLLPVSTAAIRRSANNAYSRLRSA